MSQRVGKYRHYLEIQQDTGEETQPSGQPAEDWVTIARRHASVEPVTAKEFQDAQQTSANADYVITHRYYAVTSEMRYKWGSRIFNIVGGPMNAGERGQGTETVVMCKEHRD